MTRAVIYARYSTDKQREASIDDQVELCRRYAIAQGWIVTEAYTDAAQSGASKMRPAFQRMMLDARRGAFDVVISEAIDRLGRNLSDISAAYDELVFARIALHTLAYGLTTQMHIGIMGTMAQMALKDIRDKVRRGQLGRARAGRIPGGLAYGYDVVPPPPGVEDGGERRIRPDEAAVVRRIFTDYANGTAPRTLARQLNTEGVPGPGGRPWIDTTIRGQLDRGTGLLNNTLYIGQLSWNRCSYIKDPSTRRRVARVNPKSEWEIKAVPELRIVDRWLWDQVKARQDEVRTEMTSATRSNGLNRTHRRQFLLSGLLTCGCCGGGYTVVAQDRYGCATRKGKGTCENTRTIKRQNIERRVLGALRGSMLTADLVDTFVVAFEEALASSRKDILASQLGQQREQAEIAHKIEGVMQSIERGAWTPSIGDRLKKLEGRQTEIAQKLLEFRNPAPIPQLSAAGAEIYKAQVANLETALNDPEIRAEASEALRSLIEKVVLTPDAESPDGLSALLHGELATILALATKPGKGAGLAFPALTHSTKSRGERLFSTAQLSVVAGIGFEPMTFRL